MFYDLLVNPIFLLITSTIIITMLMFLFVGRKKKPKKIEKINEKPKEKTEENLNQLHKEEKIENPTEFNEDLEGFDKVEEKEEIKNNREKKVSRVYVRKQQEKKYENEDDKEDLKYQDLSNRAEFVKTSKQISKLKGFSYNEAERQEVEEILKDDIAECEICDEIKSRIDHSRRLSDSIKNDNFDNLFASHITDHYMKIDAERHISQSSIDKLFERADELINNGESRALDADSQTIYNELKTDKEKLRFMFEQNAIKKYEENLNIEVENNDESDYEINLRNLIFAESLIKRKNMKK